MNYCMFLPVPMYGMPFLCQTKISSHHHQISLSFQNPTVSFLCSQGTLFITLLQCRPHINVHVSITHRNPRKKKSASIMPTPCRHFFRKHLAWSCSFPTWDLGCSAKPLTSVNFSTDKESMWLEQTVVQSGHWRIVSILQASIAHTCATANWEQQKLGW